MKRRTNLFYTDIEETNFLTFSNYAEHLTGDFLATNFKLFPSRFLCMYIPKLANSDERINFITNYLVAYYENKLAMLRDYIVNEKRDELNISHPDEIMHYLGYLIDAIYEYDESSRIEYISTITEQDYNGTFTDIICTIDSSATFDKAFTVLNNDNASSDMVEAKDLDKTKLYGWSASTEDGIDTYFGPSYYRDIAPVFDDANNYVFEPKHSSIKRIIKSASEKKNEEITFNVIIPLYDIVCIDKNTNDTQIIDPDKANEIYRDEFDKEETNILSLNTDLINGDYVQNVPYGIWFANENITLKRDNYSKYAPSWSLLISTQFKPFPNSSYLFADSNSGSSNGKGFATFAQILYKQAVIYDEFEKNLEMIQSMKDEMTTYINYLKTLTENVTLLQSNEEITNLVRNIIRNEYNNFYESSGTGNTGGVIPANTHNWEWQGSN